jgi:hypothetical protein
MYDFVLSFKINCNTSSTIHGAFSKGWSYNQAKFILKGILQLLKHELNTLFDTCDIFNHIGFEAICKMFNVSSLVCEL